MSVFPFPSCRAGRWPTLLLVLALATACGERRGETAEASAGAGGVAAATAPAASPTARRQVRTLGTLQATLDGGRSTWYAVAGPARDGPYASAVWLDLSDAPVLTIGALDSEDPPIEDFSREGPSLGDYRGSSLILSFPLPESGAARYPVVEGESEEARAAYLPDASTMTLPGSFHMVDGVIEVEAAAIDGRRAHARGTFSGTFRRGDGQGTILITDGRFEVDDVPEVDEVTPD